jgi:PhnB protein
MNYSPPEGYHTITPYLVVRNGTKAIEFYKNVFDAKERLVMKGPDGSSIGHAELAIGDSIFMLTEESEYMKCPSPESIGGSAVSMYIYVKDVDSTFNKALSEGASVLNPVSDKFYGDRSGYLKDPFGHLWTIATRKKDLTPDEVKKAAQAAFAEMNKNDS